jgi:hypothetical protein
MKAFRDVRTEMRESCLDLARPATRKDHPARIARNKPHDREDSDEPHPHIDPWMEAAFESLIHASETGDPFALVPCFMNGKPAAIIAAVRTFGCKVHVTPLFLACQPWMQFSEAPDEGGEEDGGGPRDRAATGSPPEPR